MVSISIVYLYKEVNIEYRTNLAYFLKYGYIVSDDIDYVFVVDGTHSINFPIEKNIRVVYGCNEYIGILSLLKRYDYYIFINSIVRCPCKLNKFWYKPILNLFSENKMIKLVGASNENNCIKPYCFAINSECLEYLLTTEIWDNTKSATDRCIIMSKIVIDKGWEIRKIPGDRIFLGLSDKNLVARCLPLNVNDMLYIKDHRIKIAICFHFGYDYMWAEFSKYIRNVYATGYDVDLFVSYQKETDPINRISREYPNTVFMRTIKGLDTGPFLLQMKHIYESKKRYDYILKIHTKKRDDWRHELLEKIAGNVRCVHTVCDTFDRHKNVGMICGHKKWIYKPDTCNKPLIDELCNTLKVNINNNTFFVAGTIFWVRWSILQQFIETSKINFMEQYEKCEIEYVINVNPTYMHCWERIYGFLVNSFGFKIVSNDLKPQTHRHFNSKRRIVKVMYGIPSIDGIDVTNSLLKHSIINLRTLNTLQHWGDPYPNQFKVLRIYFQSGTIMMLNEYETHLTPNNFVIKNEKNKLMLYVDVETDEYGNLDKYIMIKKHAECGNYRLTYFDWNYYFNKYRPWIKDNTYESCLRYHLKRGFYGNNSTFELGENLINKYKIKFVVRINETFEQKQIDKLRDINVDLCFKYSRCLDNTVQLFLLNRMKNNFCIFLDKDMSINEADITFLLKYFLSEKYINIDGQPLLIVHHNHKTEQFMTMCNKLVSQNGIKHLFFNDFGVVNNYNGDPRQICRGLVNQVKDMSIKFFDVFLRFGTDIINWKTFYCTFKAQMENILQQPNPINIGNYVFIHSIDELNNQEMLDVIVNIYHQYKNPQLHNKEVDLVFNDKITYNDIHVN